MGTFQLQDEKSEVLRLFDDYIFEYVVGDLKVLDEIQPPAYSSHCSVPTAMLILSTLDYIGFLLNPKSKKDKSEENIAFAIKYNNYFPIYYTSEVIEDIAIGFRHGMMHSFFPQNYRYKKDKVFFALHKSNGTKLFEKLPSQGGGDVLSMNVNVLSSDFRTFLDKLREHLQSPNNLNTINNIYVNFKKICPSDLIDNSTVSFHSTGSFWNNPY